MDENQTENIPGDTSEVVPELPPPAAPEKKEKRPEVIVVRNWKEYLGESLLIVFSVTLAIIVTEVFNKMHEKQQAKEVLHQLREELVANKESEEIQYQYHLQVMGKIDSALRDDNFRRRFIDSGRVHLEVIAPQGVLRKDLNDVAWQIARQNNIFSHISLETYSLLTDIYDQQQRITKSEDEIGKVLLSFESRKPGNERLTLMLLHDNYYAWAVERAPRLLEMYKKAIIRLNDY